MLRQGSHCFGIVSVFEYRKLHARIHNVQQVAMQKNLSPTAVACLCPIHHHMAVAAIAGLMFQAGPWRCGYIRLATALAAFKAG